MSGWQYQCNEVTRGFVVCKETPLTLKPLVASRPWQAIPATHLALWTVFFNGENIFLANVPRDRLGFL